MAQDSLSPASFFDVSSNLGKYGDSKSNDVDANRPKDAEFSSALNKAFRPESNRAESNQAESNRLSDKPLNKPPLNKPAEREREFFTHKPLPRHETENVHAQEGREPQAVQQTRGPQSDDDDSQATEINTSDDRWQSRDPEWSRMQPEVDDRTGVVGQSYNGAAVSYPVSRIAKESLDAKTKEALEKQGLWNLPTMVMAQPTQQLMSFKNVLGQKDALPVQKPIAQFMASLENELGVTPDRLVQALQNLPKGSLQLSPEKTMALVVKQLGLKGADQTKAMALYSKMLTQLRSLTGDNAKMLAGTMPAGAALAKMQKAQQAQQSELEANQEETNQASSISKGLDGHSAAHKMGKESVAAQTRGEDVAQLGQQSSDRTADKMAALGKNNADGVFSRDAKGQTDQSDFFSRSQDQSQSGFQGQMTSKQAETKSSLKDLGKGDVKFDLKRDLQVDTQKSSMATDKVDVNSLANSPVDSKLHFQNGSPVVSGTAAAEMKADATNSKHEAIQSIINNAQMLANKGGGEMHLTLKPEHLGEIQLKVAMDGNHVNVQMVTDRGEVKKLIEQSVHELRHGLAQHDLSMNKLEVSVGDKNTGGTKQGMPDFSAAREFGQSQFHQQQGRREMLNDLASLNTARSGLGQSDGLKATGSAARSQAYARSSTPGRLNVVA